MTTDALFLHVEKLQGRDAWGSVLDAGTGRDSLAWISGLATSRFTAVTADPRRHAELSVEFAGRLRSGDRIVSGNWRDAALLAGDVHDVVVADYLLGAVDAWAPYFQYAMLERLRPLIGQRLYVVGQEPFPDDATGEAGSLVLQIARLRDASILLAGHRPHREYPLEWTLASLDRAGLEVEDATSFPIVFGASYVESQLDICLAKLALFGDQRVAAAIEGRVESLRARALAASSRLGGLRFGVDYVVQARVRRR